MKCPRKVTARVIYEKNNAIIEAGEVLDYKKLGILKCDTMFFILRKGRKIQEATYMRPDEVEALIMVLSGALWRRHPTNRVKEMWK